MQLKLDCKLNHIGMYVVFDKNSHTELAVDQRLEVVWCMAALKLQDKLNAISSVVESIFTDDEDEE